MPLASHLLILNQQHLDRLKKSISCLHDWFQSQARDLPWRRSRDPYAIWISEVMLQQTQVTTVLLYYQRWMGLFPNINTLAEAKLDQVLHVWEGLGYYSRAQNLHRAAQIIVNQYQGNIPSTFERFISLPGVGEYTAAAVLSIAFNQDFPTIDGNVRRVLARLTALPHDPRRSPWASSLKTLSQVIMPTGRASIHNQAMMELGALLCTPRKPKCPQCPFRDVCLAYTSHRPEDFPIKKASAPIPHRELVVGVIFRQQKLFICQRPYDALLGGLWEFPTASLQAGENKQAALANEIKKSFGLLIDIGQEQATVQHAYSHFRVTLFPYHCTYIDTIAQAREITTGAWVAIKNLKKYAMHRASRKILQQVQLS